MLKTREKTKPSFKNKYQFLKKIDQLPTGPKWVCEVIHVTGNKKNMNSTCRSEELELWRRDPVDCVAQLLGDPAFKDVMSYVPERVFQDKAASVRVFDEMWTADWWWNTQVSVPVKPSKPAAVYLLPRILLRRTYQMGLLSHL